MPIVHDFKRARLVKSNHKKDWCIQFYVWDIQKNNLIRKKKFIPERLKKQEAKEVYAKKLIKAINDLLRKGYHIDRTLNPEKLLQEEQDNIQLSFMEVIPRYINYCEKIAKNSPQEVSSKFFILKRFSVAELIFLCNIFLKLLNNQRMIYNPCFLVS